LIVDLGKSADLFGYVRIAAKGRHKPAEAPLGGPDLPLDAPRRSGISSLAIQRSSRKNPFFVERIRALNPLFLQPSSTAK
jgi:hypothetical protein